MGIHVSKEYEHFIQWQKEFLIPNSSRDQKSVIAFNTKEMEQWKSSQKSVKPQKTNTHLMVPHDIMSIDKWAQFCLWYKVQQIWFKSTTCTIIILKFCSWRSLLEDTCVINKQHMILTAVWFVYITGVCKLLYRV